MSISVLSPLAAASTADSQGTLGSTLYMVVTFAIVIGVFYFFMIRPQRKKEKETQHMRNALQVGDEIVTVGGIVGRVVSIKDDTLIVETGADRNKIRVKKWAVQSNATVHDS